MVDVTRNFQVTQTPDAVIRYLQDFSHAEEWDPGTVRCTRNDSGPIRVGSTWHNVSQFMGSQTELTYELTRLENNRVTFTGRNKTATTVDDISVTPGETSGTSAITYHASITFSGAAKLAAPAAKLAFEKLGNDTAASLTRVFDQAGR